MRWRRRARATPTAREGRPIGPLHGVPVGVKDIIDTADMPTEDGTVLHAGRMPARGRRRGGAAARGRRGDPGQDGDHRVAPPIAPGKTRNPHNPAHTPGGSSSGSAAAVAAGMVPLALGSQTNGSVIRPAAFCGVYGFKPTHGLIPRHGILKLSRTLDHVGVFARTLEDIALLAEAARAATTSATPTRGRARASRSCAVAAEEPPLPPRLRVREDADAGTAPTRTRARRSPSWSSAWATQCEEVELPESVRRGLGLAPHDHGSRDGREPRARMGAGPRPAVASRCARSSSAAARSRALDYQQALARMPMLNEGFDELFARLRRHPDAGRAGHRAARARVDRRSGVLHAVDAAAACRR